MSAAMWKTLPFESAVHSRGSGNSGLPTKEWLPDGQFPVIGQGAEDIEGWTDREDLLLTPTPAVVLYGGHTRRAKHVSQPFVPGPNVKILQPVPAVDSKFLFYFLTQLPVESKGYADHFPLVRKCDVPVPPLAEQQRIVGLLDEAFEGLAISKANAEKNLQNARALFESHLQSVFTQRGPGWVGTTLGEAFDVRDGTHDSPKYHATGYPLITSKNLKREGLSFDDVKLISEQDYTKINERSAVHKGDVLFAMIGTIGNPTLVEVEPKFAIKNVALFKNPKGQSGAFLKHYLDSGMVISKMMKEAKGTTQKFVGLGYLRGFPINVPPLATQLEVVEELDDLSEETQRLARLYERKLAALEALKKSLLHQAFSGEL
jgi:hypothetical protein